MTRAMKKLLVVLGGALPLMLLAPACGGSKSGEEAGGGGVDKAAQMKARIEAKQIYDERCTTCHGAKGKGDGTGAAALDPKPRDFTSHEWQASVDDAAIEKIIVVGGAAVGKSAGMAPNPDLESKPLVVTELRKMIRNLGK